MSSLSNSQTNHPPHTIFRHAPFHLHHQLFLINSKRSLFWSNRMASHLNLKNVQGWLIIWLRWQFSKMMMILRDPKVPPGSSPDLSLSVPNVHEDSDPNKTLLRASFFSFMFKCIKILTLVNLQNYFLSARYRSQPESGNFVKESQNRSVRFKFFLVAFCPLSI